MLWERLSGLAPSSGWPLVVCSGSGHSCLNPVVIDRAPIASERCPDCDDKGYRLFDNQIFRCDRCRYYANDLQAAIAFFESRDSTGFRLEKITVKPIL
jgi:hypothetical protein